MTNHAVCDRADLSERTKTMRRHGDRRGQIAAFRDSYETINWLHLLFKCGIKTKTHFERLLWHWSSLGQLNLEPTRPDGLVGCKVPTDLVKISVKEATHMGFYHNTYQQHCTGSRFSLWVMKMTTTTKLVEFSFLSPVCLLVPLNAKVLVVVVVVGLCRDPDHRFPFSAATHTASLWHKMQVRGYQNNFQEPVL